MSIRLKLQKAVDAAYAEMGIRNSGAGRCIVRPDSRGIGSFWVRVHDECLDPETLARKLIHAGCVKDAKVNGSGNYVIIWP